MRRDVRKSSLLFRIKLIFLCVCLAFNSSLQAQNYEVKSALYNSLVGGVTACAGAIINKKKEEKWYRIFVKKFAMGAAGGCLMYGGKKMNTLIANENSIGYAWLSRGVFSAGMSVVENVASGRKFWSVWHYDVGFIRLEYDVDLRHFQPKIMPSSFGSALFLAIHGRFDAKTTLASGALTFRTRRIDYQPTLIGSTVTNAFLLSDTLNKGRNFYDLFAHEMVHTLQFAEFSGANHFFKPFTDTWETKSTTFRNVHRWVYGDLNHELMLFHYFIVQGGSRGNYCKNYLENEAEVLTVGRVACDY